MEIRLIFDQLAPGIMNAWLLLLVFAIMMFIPDLIIKFRKKSRDLFIPSSGDESKHDLAWKTVYMVAIIYSIFLQLKTHTAWIWAGLTMCLFAVALWFSVIRVLLSTPEGRPFVEGPYRYSRHPMYIAQALFLLGITTATLSPVFLVIALILILLASKLAVDEEGSCLIVFGEEYEKYTERTNRWLGRSGN